ncbi:MAG: ZIP family metal transporter [Fuerstiella sp.]
MNAEFAISTQKMAADVFASPLAFVGRIPELHHSTGPFVDSLLVMSSKMSSALLVAVDDNSASDGGVGWAISLLAMYCLAVVVASLLGGWLPTLIRLTHTRLQTMISFVGGLMLGIGVFHMLPHSVDSLGNAHLAGRWMMVGIAMTFVLLRLFHFHNHEPVTLSVSKNKSHDGHQHDGHKHDGHKHCDHDRNVSPVCESVGGADHSAAECHSTGHNHGVSWIGIAFGLSLHTLFDGIALGASVHMESGLNSHTWFFGLGTFLAVLLHKPLDAVSISALMVADGWNRQSIAWVNLGFALMCPFGAALFYAGVQHFPGFRTELVGTTLAFACGVFVCISLSDLLPEMEFHAHNKVQLTIALTSGIALAWLLTLLEPGHM